MKLFITVLAVAVFLSGAALAQATSPDQNQSPSSSQSSQPQQATPAQPDQNQSMSQNQSQSSSDQTLTGCISRGADQALVLQPDSGGVPIKLSGSSSDLSSNLNHQARVTGHFEAGQSASAAGQNPSSIAGNPSSQSQAESNFIVSKVESVSDTCKSSNPSTPPASSTPPPPAVR